MDLDGGWILEVDLRKFFDTLVHQHLRTLIQKRVRDGALNRLPLAALPGREPGTYLLDDLHQETRWRDRVRQAQERDAQWCQIPCA